jgi:hypothetical protein
LARQAVREERPKYRYGCACGIDLHSNNHVITILDEADRRVFERRVANDLALT